MYLGGLFLLTALFIVGATGATVTIGVSLSLTNANPNLPRVALAHSERDGINLWLNSLPNQQIKVANTTYDVKVVIMDDEANATLVTQNYRTMAADPTINFFFGGVNSDYNLLARAVIESVGNKILIGTTASAGAMYLGAKWTFPAIQAAQNFVPTLIPVMRVKGASSIAFMYDGYSGACAEIELGQESNLKQQNIAIKGYFPIMAATGAFSTELKNNVTATVALMKETNADAFFVCAQNPDVHYHILNSLKELNWVPKIVTLTPDFTSFWPTVDTHTSNFVTLMTAFEPMAQFTSQSGYFNDSRSYSLLFKEKYGYIPSAYAALGTQAGLLLHAGIMRANSVNPPEVRDALRTIDLDSFMGRTFMAADGANSMSLILVQLYNGTRRIIAPPLFADSDIVFPIPNWNERNFTMSGHSTTEIVVIVFTATGMAISVALAILLGFWWRHQIVRASSPTFLIGMIFGSLLLYCANFVALPSGVTNATCHLQAWFLGLGFIIMFGSLFAKSWRVYRLYSNPSLNVTHLGDLELFLQLSIFVIIMIILLISFSIAGEPAATYFNLDEYRPYKNYIDCSTAYPTRFTGALSALLVYAGLVTLGGLFLAWRVRDIPYVVFDESQTIGFSIYNMSFFVILLSALRLSQAASREVLFPIQAFGIVACVLLTLLPLFYSKVDIIRSSSGVSSRKSSSTIGSSGPPRPEIISLGAAGVSLGAYASAATHQHESYTSSLKWSVNTNPPGVSVAEHDLGKENDELRLENAQLRKEVDELRSRLEHKKEKIHQHE